jgi:hypothetical protein
MNGMNKFK